MANLLHKELTGAIIGAYYEVYNHTSRVLPEYIYESAMKHELQSQGYAVTSQEEYQILYKEYVVGVQRLDLFVVQEVVVENKVAEKLLPIHKAQALSYLKTVSKTVGLIFNFGSRCPEFDRLYFRMVGKDHEPKIRSASVRAPSADWLYPEITYAIIGGLYEVHTVLGPGFVYRIYVNACYHELRLRELATRCFKRMQVTYKDTTIGDVSFSHLIVEGVVMVFPVALNSIDALHLPSLKSWMRLSGVQLGIVANFNAARLETMIIRA